MDDKKENLKAFGVNLNLEDSPLCMKSCLIINWMQSVLENILTSGKDRIDLLTTSMREAEKDSRNTPEGLNLPRASSESNFEYLKMFWT